MRFHSIWFDFEKGIQSPIRCEWFLQNNIQRHSKIFDFLPFGFFGLVSGFILDRFDFEQT